jgi:hypothetical protein
LVGAVRKKFISGFLKRKPLERAKIE